MKVLARASALVLALAAHAAQAQEPVVIRVLDRADFVLGNSRTPPPDDAPWKPVSLPDNWYLSHPGETQVGWYRFTYDLTPEQARIPHSIYLMRNSARRIDFWFNGFRHSANVAYGDPGARNWSPPMINTVSARNLSPGRNVLHIRVVAVPEIRQGLTRVMLSQGSAGRPLYEVRYITQFTTLFMFGAAALIAGLLAAAFWLRERGDTALLWFSITALAWALAAFPWLHAVFTPRAFCKGPLAFTLRFAYAVPMLVLCLRVAGQRWPVGEAALWTFTLAGLALAWFLSEDGQGVVITYWSVTYLAALFALLVVLIRSEQRERRWGFWLLAGALVPGALYVQAQRFRAWYRERVREIFQSVDVLLTPTTPCPAPKIGQETMTLAGVTVPTRPNLGLYTQPLSFIGLPVISVPVAEAGPLPLGVQLVAAPWNEAALFRVAAALEGEGVVAARIAG